MRILRNNEQKIISNNNETAVESIETISKAPAIQEFFSAICRISQSNITVLINGESGTGKELLARALYKHSPRVLESFIALNMEAISMGLIESELFGHEEDALRAQQPNELVALSRPMAVHYFSMRLVTCRQITKLVF